MRLALACASLLALTMGAGAAHAQTAPEVAFNIGVEIGQLLALGAILIVMGFWRRSESFFKHAYLANVVLMTLGFILTGYQLVGYFVA